MEQSKTRELPLMKEIWYETLQWQPEEQQQQFQRLHTKIVSGNRLLNLTRITAPEDFWEKHLWDSLSGVSNWLEDNEKQKPLSTIDIGTGAGFPGLPVAIAFPHWTVTLLDSTRKKVAFLETLVTELEIGNVRTLFGRAEAVGQQKLHRERYDLALIRAVGQAPVCAEYAVPLVKIGGMVILYRGHWSEADRLTLESAAEQLGSKIELVRSWKTPLTKSIRHCIYLRKHSSTPENFPRAIGVPNQQPLG
ncbi:16S rRNA (guanine(527)-N(7))-methyltransferase RsmG [Pleurocapsales cyanobacterium LEGE 06147]|nr:16S rRNA (guanine(527)-N(7))-methyltransferase RsmG [Pleurocapsales cyanobacterium LEGE 06147]